MQDVVQTPDEQRLLTLLSQQRDLYARLRALSERQRTLISGDRPELLLDILRERQTLVSELSRINDSLSPYRRSWETVFGELSGAARDRVTDLLDEINGTLQVILLADQEDSALLSARKQAVGRAIEDVGGARAANAAYARHSYRSDPAAADLTG